MAHPSDIPFAVVIEPHQSIYFRLPTLYFMRMNFRVILVLLLASVALTSCSSTKDDTEYYYKLKQKNEKYQAKMDRRKARIQARQERTDMWFESILN